MAKFLSEAWADEFVSALESAEGPLRTVDLTIQQIVTGTPDGDVAFWTTIDHGRVKGGLGAIADADVTFSQDYATATELSRAEINPQAAFMQGRLTITGNMGKLLKHRSAIEALGPAMASLETDY